jgi:hypothetical protein
MIGSYWLRYFFCFVILIPVFLSFFKAKKEWFLLTLLTSLFLMPFGPRDEIGMQQGDINNFVSIQSLQIFGFPLSIFLILVLSILILKKRNFILQKPKYIYFLIVFTVFSISISFIYPVHNKFIFFISDFRNFIVFYLGVILTSYFNKLQLLKGLKMFLIFGTLILSSKTIIIIIYDTISSNNYLTLGTLPYLFIPVLCYFLIENKIKFKKLFIILSLFCCISASRGNIIIFFLSVMFTLYLIARREKSLKIFLKIIFSVVIISPIFIYVVSFFNTNLINLFSYKLDFFSSELFSGGELNESTAIRLLESNQIFTDGIDNFIFLIFGKGMGGGFSFPLGINLTTAAFSQIQLDLNFFYRPHTFINYFMLKGGLVLLFLFSYVNISIFKKFIKSQKNIEVFISLFILLSPFYYWVPEFIFLNGMFYGLVRKN